MRVFVRTGVVALACAALAAGCGGDGDDEESTPTPTTPSDVLNAVFERSFSECGSESVEELAGKYRVDPNSAAVSTAVGIAWAERFGGHADAQREGKLACLRSLAMGAPPKKQAPPTVTVQP